MWLRKVRDSYIPEATIITHQDYQVFNVAVINGIKATVCDIRAIVLRWLNPGFPLNYEVYVRD